MSEDCAIRVIEGFKNSNCERWYGFNDVNACMVPYLSNGSSSKSGAKTFSSSSDEEDEFIKDSIAGWSIKSA
uniref:Uncharacterized protein n=1 Tax=Meloidogyne enterolobii TaxID=390850 RepID=A0A6V7X353_MELEN|nr:unnamed protein product [Meloidogyne enterolobii]